MRFWCSSTHRASHVFTPVSFGILIGAMRQACIEIQKPPNHFSHIGKNGVLKKIKKLGLNKTTQDLDILARFLKESANLFADYIYLQFKGDAKRSLQSF